MRNTLVPLAVLVLLGASALRGGERTAQYVALGSSYAAGPGLGERAPGSVASCSQTTENYAHRLAVRRGLSLVDVSCSGATTEDVLRGGQFGLPAQLEAVRPETELVTVTIGGNDVSFVGNLMGWSCQNAPAGVPKARPCKVTTSAEVEAAFGQLEGRLRGVVEGVRGRAPRARVVFVDYVTVLPSSGGCPDRLPLTREELADSQRVAARLAAMTASVAKSTRSELVKASELTRGHDVCAADAWVSGVSTVGAGAVPYHPTAAAMEAIAGALDRMLGARRPLP